MDVLHPCCAGLDVHKKTVVACVLRSDAAGVPARSVRTFGTMLDDLGQLRDWLAAADCTHVVMEATGVYWKPVYNVLEDAFTLLVANAEHVKRVPGCKTDVSDAEWLATLLRHGLVQASFIPERPQWEVRELIRFRTSLIQDRARAVNRLQKTLEGANLKLASVLTDITGVSGQRILDALLRGETDPEQLAELAHWRVLQSKRGTLERALVGRLSDTLSFVVAQQLQQIRALDDQIAACDGRVGEELRPFDAEIELLDGIPGVGRRTAEVLIAEWGADLSRFPSAGHLAAWSGMCPGNKASGGKRQPVHTRKGNPWVRRSLTEAAWAAGRVKGSYLGVQFRRFAARKGRKHAVVVVGHSILTVAYYLLTHRVSYRDLGVEYLETRDREATARQAVKRLQALGWDVRLTPCPVAA